MGGLIPSVLQEGVLALIPIRNEEAFIGTVVEGCRSFGIQVWVLDDGSSDRGAERAQKAGAKVFSLHPGRGKGAALKFALNQLPENIEWVLFLDGDLQHLPEEFVRFWEKRGECDAILGNRFGELDAMPLVRRWTNQFMSWIINQLFGGNEPDTQCGYRLVRASFLKTWRPAGNRYEFETELYLYLLHSKARLSSIPVSVRYENENSDIFWPRDLWNFLKCVNAFSGTIKIQD